MLSELDTRWLTTAHGCVKVALSLVRMIAAEEAGPANVDVNSKSYIIVGILESGSITEKCDPMSCILEIDSKIIW